MIAALYVATGGCYFGLPDVDPWDEARDARLYAGPHRVVAHPPCARWGRYSTGGPSHAGQYQTGDDGGCFKAALDAVWRWGGVLEHPADSKAWDTFGIRRPPRDGGWIRADGQAWTCCVDQQHYGHTASKPTWLYCVTSKRPPDLVWGCPQVGLGKRGRLENLSKRQRAATPEAFRDLLLSLARGC